MKNLIKRKFTLYELIIVMGILAVTAGFIIPLIAASSASAEQDVVTHEMSKIREAFSRLEKDCQLNDAMLDEIVKYGVWPLIQYAHPEDSLKDYKKFNINKNKGWRGKYINFEDEVLMDSSSTGQDELAGGVNIPVLRDPYSGYYRVISPSGGATSKLVLVCTGVDAVLNTGVNDKDSNGDIAAQGDDLVLRLLPLR